MKIISIKKRNDHEEIVVQKSFLWFNWYVVYRKINEHYFRYASKNTYYKLSFYEYLIVRDLFDIPESMIAEV
ncbi:hypothetical protein ACLOAU_14575 [Niabella sp. CJ426]|uniref:hypothetical protein n=1 Tax=Niabella sp. CJ426 TaxID=3393740 RepID=UPI003D04723C